MVDLGLHPFPKTALGLPGSWRSDIEPLLGGRIFSASPLLAQTPFLTSSARPPHAPRSAWTSAFLTVTQGGPRCDFGSPASCQEAVA